MTRFMVLVWMCLAVSLAGVSSAPAQVIEPALQREIRIMPPTEMVAVIITVVPRSALGQFKGLSKAQKRAGIALALRSHAQIAQAQILDRLRVRNSRRIRSLWIANAIAAEVPAAAISEIASLPGVDRIQLDSVLTVPATRAPFEAMVRGTHTPNPSCAKTHVFTHSNGTCVKTLVLTHRFHHRLLHGTVCKNPCKK